MVEVRSVIISCVSMANITCIHGRMKSGKRFLHGRRRSGGRFACVCYEFRIVSQLGFISQHYVYPWQDYMLGELKMVEVRSVIISCVSMENITSVCMAERGLEEHFCDHFACIDG